MIQDIHPHRFENTYVANQQLAEEDYVFVFDQTSLLLKQENDKVAIPRKKDLNDCPNEGIFCFHLMV
ncbi:MAG: hypothetical protein PF444_00095 [Bacteroidales bacterium]|jgi:NAD+ diphosphatase|nr:hypothetical protein [Bacteroidales bacterium]